MVCCSQALSFNLYLPDNSSGNLFLLCSERENAPLDLFDPIQQYLAVMEQLAKHSLQTMPPVPQRWEWLVVIIPAREPSFKKYADHLGSMAPLIESLGALRAKEGAQVEKLTQAETSVS